MENHISIGNTTFYLTKLPPRQAAVILGDLQRDLLPAVGGLLGSMADEKEVDETAIADSIERFSKNLSGDRVSYWMDKLITPETVAFEKDDGKVQKVTKANFDGAFDDPFVIFELIAKIIIFNFKEPLMAFLARSGLEQKFRAVTNQPENSQKN